ncbi:SAM-dependent methyltransferase [Candidatus Pacearchaeota archaeon]|nr:MAG: SAM-dependent methyltransferase [Candidatus Pacearchaeota archaeon]
MTSNKIIEYYNHALIDYKRIWRLDRNLAIHYGYYDSENKTHDKAVVNMNRVLSEIAKITPKDRVLDAGCGIGGSSIWIAKNIGARVTGLNIHKGQLEIARQLAIKNRVENLTEFTEGDFTKTNLQDNSFDVVLGLESVCYAKNKKDFIREARRILKNNGRLVVADGFLQKENLDVKEKEEMKKWLNGWAVPNLSTLNDFKKYLKQLKFTNVKFLDIKKNVMPSSTRMYKASIICYPIGKILEFLGIRNKTQTANIVSAFYQHKTLKKGLWTYGIFYAEKSLS